MVSPVLDPVTIKDFVVGGWDNFTDHNPIFGALEEKAHIRKGCEGTSVDWSVRVGRYVSRNVEDMEDVSGAAKQNVLDMRCNLPWGSRFVDDTVSKREYKKQGEKATLRKLWDDRIPQMTGDLIDDGIGADFLLDGGTASESLGGLPAIHPSYTAGTEKDNKAGGTFVVTGSYAGQSLALNGITGIDGAVSDAWTPGIVNTGATWASGGTGFDKTNAVEIMQHAINLGMIGNKDGDRLNCGVLPRNKFLALKSALVTAERIVVGQGDSSKRFGLGSSVEFVDIDGLKILWDQNLDGTSQASETLGYLLNLDKIWLDVLRVGEAQSGDKVPGGKKGSRPDMFDVECSYLPFRRGSYISMEFNGQFRINPRYQVVIGKFSA